MTSITSENPAQYADSRRLGARAQLHRDYTVAETGWFRWIAERLPLKPGDQVLDIGCGPGWFWASVADSLPEGLGLTLSDLSDGMLREATEHCRSLPITRLWGCRADAAHLPFEAESFDGVVAMHMLYHLPEPRAAIIEADRVLKPGGWFAVTTNGEDNMRELYALTATLSGEPNDPAGRVFGYEEAERLLQSRFSPVTVSEHPAYLQVTDPDAVFEALTSYPPGDRATEAQRVALRDAIAASFRSNGGALTVRKHSALFLSRKPDR